MLSAEYRKESRGNDESVCTNHSFSFTFHSAKPILIPCSSLLEIFGLLKAINQIKDAESSECELLVQQYENLVQVICDDHVTAAQSHIKDERLRNQLTEDIKNECGEIVDYRKAVDRWKLEIDSRSKDRLVSFGEKLSCRYMAALLRDVVGLDIDLEVVIKLICDRVWMQNTLICQTSYHRKRRND